MRVLFKQYADRLFHSLMFHIWTELLAYRKPKSSFREKTFDLPKERYGTRKISVRENVYARAV